ncbi:MAG: hypothetical protein Kow0031_22020 [Anaerolineae bacterium]
MGWSAKVDGLSFVLPLDYHLREPFAARLQQKRQLLASNNYDLICLENADNESVAIIEANRHYRGFHVIRDPRDIVVSGYFSHLKTHPVSANESPWLYEYRQHLQSLPDIEAGLLAELEFCTPYFERLRAWDYNNPNVLELRYETLTAQPETIFLQIFEFLGIKTPQYAPLTTAAMTGAFGLHRWLNFKQPRREKLPSLLLQAILWHNSFRRRSGGRHHGQENQAHHYRKGVAGDWRNYFTPSVKAAFKSRYGDLVVHLSYEPDNNW